MHSEEPLTGSSYGRILRATALLGGAHGIIYVLSIVRSKVVAVLSGASGIGALSLFQSLVQMIQTVSGFGIATSGARSIAAMQASGSRPDHGAKIVDVRRLSLLVGFLGSISALILASPLSHLMGQGSTLITDFVILSGCIVFLTLSAGEGAVLQGLGNLNALAKTQVQSAGLGALIIIAGCYFFGIDSLSWALVLSSLTTWIVTRHATRVVRAAVQRPWSSTLSSVGPLLSFGGAVMLNALGANLVALAARALVVRHSGLEANGMLQAALMLSGMSVSFLLSAMGTDLLPRLAAARGDCRALNRLINEQLEVALLICFPGLLITLALCPWLVDFLYSSQFKHAIPLIPWFLAGNLLQICGWPIGFIQMIESKTKVYVATQTLFHIVHILGIAILLPLLGIVGVAVAFVIAYALYLPCISLYAHRTTGFSFFTGTTLILALCFFIMLFAIAIHVYFSALVAALLVAAIAFCTALLSASRLALLLPQGHRFQSFLARLSLRRSQRL